MNKNKKLLKLGYSNGTYVITYCPVRVRTSMLYSSFDDVLKDFPLSVYKIQIEDLSTQVKNLVCDYKKVKEKNLQKLVSIKFNLDENLPF